MYALVTYIWVRLLRVAMSHCYDTDIYFDAGATEKPRLDLNTIPNLKTLLIFT